MEYKVLNIGKSDMNNNIYPPEEVKKAVNDYKKRIASSEPTFGEFGKGGNNVHIDISRVSHEITDIYIKDNSVYCTINILNTNLGQILKNLKNSDISFGLTSIMLGKLGENNTMRDMKFIKFNAVPSDGGRSQ